MRNRVTAAGRRRRTGPKGIRNGVAPRVFVSALAVTAVAVTVLLGTTRGRGRPPRCRWTRPSSHTRVDEIVDAAAAVREEIVRHLDEDTGRPEELCATWADVHGRLVALESAATALADRQVDTRAQRDLDSMAAAVIRLRGALEANVRLRDDEASADRDDLLAASDDMVAVASEDLRIGLRHLVDAPWRE